MSSGERRISYSFGMTIARRMVDLLEIECERIEIAGSLRRKKSDVGDIEIVLIPKDEDRILKPAIPPQPTLFTSESFELFGRSEPERIFGHERITRRLEDHGYELSKNGELFKQAHLPNSEFTFDIFLTTPEKWGCVFTIRTGNALFSQRLVTPRSRGGMCPSNLGFKGGRVRFGKHVWNESKRKTEFFPDMDHEPLDTPEEEDVFRVLGLDWIEPEKRW